MPLADVVGETEPHGAVEHVTVQLTPRLAGSFVTEAVKLVVSPACSEVDVGVTETLITAVTEPPPPQPEKAKARHRAYASLCKRENCRVGMANLPRIEKEPRKRIG